MSINIRDEELVRLNDVPKLRNLPAGRSSGRIHISTVYRWASRGLRGVRLEILQVGGSKCTSIEALQRFFENLTPGSEKVGRELPGFQRASPRWSKRRLREIEAAERYPEEMGI